MSSGNPARLAWRIFGLAFGALVLWLIYHSIAPDLRRIEWSDLVAQRPALAPLVASFVVLVAAQLVHAFMWRRIAIDIGSPAPNARATLHVYFVSSLARYVPGKVWQLAGMAVLAARFGMAAGRAAAASILAQLAFVATGLVVLGFALPDLAETLDAETILRRVDPLVLGGLLLLAVVLAIWLLAATPVGASVRRLLLRLAGPRMGGKLGNAVAVAEDITVRNGVVWLLGYGVSWVMVCGAFVLFAGSFHGEALAEPVLIGGVVAAAYLAGFIMPFLPAGAGTREAVMVGLLTPVMPLPVAFMIAITSRIWFTAAELLPLAFIPLAPGPAASAAVPVEIS